MTDNTERDELADVIEVTVRLTGDSKTTADAILAAGFRRPRTITTQEELDALPLDSVVRDIDGYLLRKMNKRSWLHGAGLADVPLPVTLLWVGGADE